MYPILPAKKLGQALTLPGELEGPGRAQEEHVWTSMSTPCLLSSGQLAACHIHQVPGQVSTTSLYLSIEEGWGGVGVLVWCKENGGPILQRTWFNPVPHPKLPFLQEWEELWNLS